MSLNQRSSYVIKQSNGTTWNFSYSENTGIVYKFFEKSKWTSYQVVTDQGTENFSVVLLSDDRICVLYQDKIGHINLSMHDGNQWSDRQILKNEQKELFQIYFKAIAYKNQAHVIYSILNKQTRITTLFHQILDEKNSLSDPKIIDIIKFEYEIPFILYSEDAKGIYIMYQRLVDNHQIGYKVFNKDNKDWNNFYVIDRSSKPYRDYSMAVFRGNLNIIYIKDDQETHSLIYVHGDNVNLKHGKLLESTNIDSCLLFILNNQIWCAWVQEDKVYSNFSVDNGESFSMPPYVELLDTLNIVKSIYSSNDIKDMKDFILNEVYITNEEPLKYLIISDMYPNINNKDINDLSCIAYFMDKIGEMMLMHEKKFKQREQFVSQLKHMLEEQKIKLLSYESKFEEINKEYAKFREGKQLLNENVSYLQESLIAKEQKLNELENFNIEKENEILFLKEKIYHQEHGTLTVVEEEPSNILENINIEKDNEICYLKEEISEQDQKILSLIEEVKNLKDHVEDLTSQLSVANSKLNNSFFKRIFNNE